MFPTELPAEIIILLLSYLPLSAISALSRLNREWYNFIQENDMNRETIYRDAALYEGYIPQPTILVKDLIPSDSGPSVRKALYPRRTMVGIKTWKEFCKKRRLIERAWSGRAPSTVVPSPRPPGPHGPIQTETRPDSMHYHRVHRIKVDEKVGITMATTQLGGLIVRDLETDVVLWELPTWYVRRHAHLEYGEGYMIFDRNDGNKEVWRRTAEIPIAAPSSSMDTSPDDASSSHSSDTEVEVDELSLPDERQRHVMNYISHLTPVSHPPPPTSSSSTSASEPPNAKARFTAHAVLHMPEPSRAYRFVYPHLLVASLERAYVWDVRVGKIVETVEGIQVIQPNTGGVVGAQVHHDGEDGHDDDDQPDVRPSNLGQAVASNQAQNQGIGTVDLDIAMLADILPPPSHMASSTGAPYHEPYIPHPTSPEPPTDEDEDELDPFHEPDSGVHDGHDPAHTRPQFLGLVRYVDLSPRHLFFAGRYLLRVFSRATGKCVLDIPSTRWRYGQWKWEVASQASNVGMGVGQGVGCDGDVERDDYARAREEGREAVRMPVRCSSEEYSSASKRKLVIDQFVAVHVSADGKHLVAMLSGSRLVIIHHFESLLAKRRPLRSSRPVARHAASSVPENILFSSPGAGPSSSSASSSTGTSTALTSTSSSALQASRQGSAAQRFAAATQRRAEQEKRREQLEKDEEIYVNTLDVQLGAPSSSSSIYLAYENGRIGVVTSNAVYIVIPTIPPSPPAAPGASRTPTLKNPHEALSRPTTSSTPLATPLPLTRAQPPTSAASRPSNPTATPTHLSIVRLPYFNNPSWLSEVSCLMMSDTGLFLNWNPAWPKTDEELDDPFEMVDGGDPMASLYEDASDPEEQEKRQRMWEEWEREYEDDLRDYERDEEARYHVFPNGDMLVSPGHRDLEECEISTIYRVDLAPTSQSSSSLPASLSQQATGTSSTDTSSDVADLSSS